MHSPKIFSPYTLVVCPSNNQTISVNCICFFNSNLLISLSIYLFLLAIRESIIKNPFYVRNSQQFYFINNISTCCTCQLQFYFHKKIFKFLNLLTRTKFALASIFTIKFINGQYFLLHTKCLVVSCFSFQVTVILILRLLVPYHRK